MKSVWSCICKNGPKNSEKGEKLIIQENVFEIDACILLSKKIYIYMYIEMRFTCVHCTVHVRKTFSILMDCIRKKISKENCVHDKTKVLKQKGGILLKWPLGPDLKKYKLCEIHFDQKTISSPIDRIQIRII